MAKTITASNDAPGAATLARAFQDVAYAASAAQIDQLPPEERAEVAFVGRSNAGKSSAINAICARRKLAFVSRTPGRTQMINFFSAGEGRALVDLPGYGYARVPVDIRERWEALLSFYLLRRTSLRGLIIIVDARHGITDLDKRMLDWFSLTGKPIHLLLTKADKLTRQQQMLALRAAKKELDLSPARPTVQVFSGVTHDGVDEARARIVALWSAAAETEMEA